MSAVISSLGFPAGATPLGHFFQFLGASAGTGLAIKMMDDFLDQDLDHETRSPNWTYFLGKGILPYALLLLALGFFLQPTWSLALFLASYALGMGHALDEYLPTGLRAYQEAVLAFILAFLLVGWRFALGAVALVAVLQFLDDWRDYQMDVAGGKRQNWVRLLGSFHSALLGVLLGGWALVLVPLPALAGFSAFAGIGALSQCLPRRRLRRVK